MKRFAIPVLAVMLVLGVNTVAMALDDGTYDFYGTYKIDPYFADGAGQECALALNGLPCPSSTQFCVKNLDVTGNIITSNEDAPYYGIAVGIVDGTLQDMDFDGVGAVNLKVDDTGDADTLQTLVVGETSGGSCSGGELGAAAFCATSMSASMQPPAGGSGTVTGEIPVQFNGEPTTYTSCAGGLGVYPAGILTTETAEGNISNENGDNQTRSLSGSRLAGNNITLVHMKAVMRTVILGTPVGTETFGGGIWEGTLCKRTDPGISCIPGGFTCPAEAD